MANPAASWVRYGSRRRIALPGSGIAANLADKVRRLGIPVWRFGDGGA
ncbi:hypothetical protein [Azospirillum argentinense]